MEIESAFGQDCGKSGEPGLRTLGERKGAIAKFIGACTTYAGIEDAAPVLWLSQTRFRAFYEFWDKMSPEESLLKWQADVANPDIKRKGSGDNVLLGVMDNPTTTPTTGRRVDRQVQREENGFTKDQVMSMLQRMASLGHGNLTQLPEFQGMADVFQVGAASSSSGFEIPGGLFVGSRAAPPPAAPAVEAIASDAFIDEKKKELQPIGPVPKRSLAATLSDPDAKRGGNKLEN